MSDVTLNVNDLFVSTASEVVVTGGERKVVFIPKGTIKIYPIYIQDDPSAPFEVGTDSFGRAKYGMWCYVASDGGFADKMPPEFESRILPIILPSTAVQALTEILQQKDEDSGESLYSITIFNGGKVVSVGDLYAVKRSGAGKNDTKYTVLPSKAGKTTALPDNLTLPTQTLAEAMADYSQWQAKNTPENQADDEDTDDETTEGAKSLF